jgi:hypothetical protein
MDFNTRSSPGGPSRQPGSTPPRSSPGGEFSRSDPVRSFVDTFRRVIFSPKDFFHGLPPRGSFLDPLIFAVVCAVIDAILTATFQELAHTLLGMQFFSTDTGFVLNALRGFVLTIIALVVVTGVYQLFVRIIIGANNGGLEATFRVLCYVQAVQPFTFLPLLNLLAGIYGLYLSAFGFQEVHSTTYGRAAAVAALPIVLLILVVTLFFGALIGLSV